MGDRTGIHATERLLADCLDGNDAALLRQLVCRDERILEDGGEVILPGTAFLENIIPEEEADNPAARFWPEHLSGRVMNFYTLYDWLIRQGEEEDLGS